jgi:hypothetical protein
VPVGAASKHGAENARLAPVALWSRSDLARRLSSVAILLIPVVLVGLSFWPGHMSADTLTEIEQVDRADFTNQHAPLLLALWSPLWDLGVGPGWVLAGQIVTFVVGVYLLLRTTFGRVSAATIALVISLSPPVFGMLGTLGRDTWFTALLLVTFGLTVRAAQRPWPQRGAYLAFALAGAWLSLATRQNAAAAVVLACIVMAALVLERRRERRDGGVSSSPVRRLIVATAVGVALTFALVGTQFAGSAVIGVHNSHPEYPLYLYDVAAISARERENLFPREVLPQRGIRVIDANYHIDSMLAWGYLPNSPFKVPLSEPAGRALADSWREAVLDHPLAYLDARVDLWLRQISVTRDAMWIYHPVIDPNTRGLVVEFPELNRIANDYEQAFANDNLDGGAVFTVWAYLIVALTTAIVLLRRRRGWALTTVGALAVAALTYQIGLFIGAMGTQYRFELPAVVIGMLGAAILIKLASAALIARRGVQQEAC